MGSGGTGGRGSGVSRTEATAPESAAHARVLRSHACGSGEPMASCTQMDGQTWNVPPLWDGLPDPPVFLERLLQQPIKAFSTKAPFAHAVFNSLKGYEFRNYIWSDEGDSNWRYVFASDHVSPSDPKFAKFVEDLQNKPPSFPELPDKSSIPHQVVYGLVHLSRCDESFAPYDNYTNASYPVGWCIDGLKPLHKPRSYKDEDLKSRGVKNIPGRFYVPEHACEDAQYALCNCLHDDTSSVRAQSNLKTLGHASRPCAYEIRARANPSRSWARTNST